MKTTVELPDELLIKAKQRAAELRKPLRALIEEGLRAQLRAGRTEEPVRSRKKKKINWVTIPGELPADVDLSDRVAMHEWFRKIRGR